MKSAIVLDASILIAYGDRSDAHHALVRKAIGPLLGRTRLIASAVSLSEAIVGPARQSRFAAENALLAYREFLGLEVVPVDEPVALETATLRAANRSLKTPDAVVVATTRTHAADFALTTDHRLARMDEAVTVKSFLGSTRRAPSS